MDINYINQIKTQFRDLVLNSAGAKGELFGYLGENDVVSAIDMMDSNDKEVSNALREYNPQTHKVMTRPNKPRKGEPPYITEKLPRTRARYINEVELFFLLGKPIEWEKVEGDDEGFGVYNDFLDDYYMGSLIRRAKRKAGSETECAIVFHIAKNGDNVKVSPFIAARSTGYRLRTLFNQYGGLEALAYGYTIQEKGKKTEHWDILTAEFNFYCTFTENGWTIDTYKNPTGKINAVYFKQAKAWDGAVPRIEREEMLDSKLSDTNNYFADPMAAATADVIDNLTDPDKPGRLIQLTGPNSKFGYIDPPTNSMSRADESKALKESILFDTLTPDLSYENMKGLGSLSGVALKNALIQGYIKRDNLIETYGEMVGRLRNVIIGVLKLLHPDMAPKLDKLRIKFSFAEPFDSDKRELWGAIVNLYGGGVISLETAVGMLKVADAPEEECERIRMMAMELEQAKVEAAKEIAGIKQKEQEEVE